MRRLRSATLLAAVVPAPHALVAVGSGSFALAADDAHYAVVKSLDEVDAQAPSNLGIAAQITDRDAMLVRSNLPSAILNADNVQSAHFSNIVVVSRRGGPPIPSTTDGSRPTSPASGRPSG